MTDTFIQSNFSPGLKELYHGKVRDVYIFDDLLIVVAPEQISAIDVMPEAILYKA